MADADEDAVRAPATASTEPDIDLSDETQDFRFLNHLNFFADSSPSIPRRGEKDFEPNPTELQADVLSASRGAMHNALSYPRLHGAKTRIIAFYAPDGYVPPVQIDRATPKASGEDGKSSESTPKPARPLPNSARISPDACVYVPNPKGQFFKTMGQADSTSRIWLLPEEALYLIERGSLDIRWPSPSGSTEDLSVPMSLQAAYACFMGRGGLTLERYSVYTGLKRLGYALVRAPGWCDDIQQQDADALGSSEITPPKIHGPGLAGMLASLFNWIHDPHSTASTATGPIIGTGIHRSYMDVYRKLAIIPWYDPVTAPERHPFDTTPPFRVVFHIYKPSTPIKKSALPTPDFRIAVVSTRDQTTMPTMTQLGALLESTPLDPPRGEKMDRMMYMRLRHGYRNVVMAVVDQGVVSYLRIADSAFGKEKLYENKGGPQGHKRNYANQKSRKR
ncbi:hypothetical protein DTO013E5_760 [Penicillium roqueforti]|uniref:tRNA-splicing endonuclease, subunit Sen54, N-terminal n=1 Tax=Penicillium roqueforti (strain FM164) TaxID=1365484 RepID=W6QP61_PENRF|nr:uncharacterized protein LCP9604111_1140 [Penicillium roqueforti]CDM31377.1 tRNA-splicing endonuclease, subunit Sen54, N-terminal [Penicillium roqueforti FM164]KAF9253614.1 hypothetical protein LCP9604111_1140 [Penicillium roqueforti]KAI2686358.1 hypothetical protein CBS147355_1845 [Penicillium roqueforti]KAI2691593.1 hypothetical protein LCP963914a_1794 [Penicillium roqueforti]KAI2706377.1 hypothetical protein CBS147372_288 [Penicillium roqueforti]